MPSNHLIRCFPLLLLPPVFPSIRVFSNELALCIRWPKYWSFSFSISPSNEYSGLFSFRIDWFDLPAAQGTLKSLLQHHSSKASIFWPPAFFMVQLSHPYMTTVMTWVTSTSLNSQFSLSFIGINWTRVSFNHCLWLTLLHNAFIIPILEMPKMEPQVHLRSTH